MKAAATWNIVCDQGKTFERTLTYKVGGVPFDLTNFEARMQVKKSLSSTAVLDLDSANGEITLGGTAGEVSWSVSAVDMEDLIGNYLFDVEIYDPNDVDTVYAPVRGTIHVRPEVTT